MKDIAALEHSFDRNASAGALAATVGTDAIMLAISLSPQTPGLAAIFAGVVAGGTSFFGMKYFAGLQLALDKPPAEKLAMKKQILSFGPVQALALSLTMAGMGAVYHNVNGYARNALEEYHRALDALPAMDPNSIQPGTNLTARESFCDGYTQGKTLIRRFDGELMALDCSLR